MDLATGLSLSLLILSTAFGIYILRTEKEIRKLKRRTRYIGERLEAVEKYNGLNQTNTDIRAL